MKSIVKANIVDKYLLPIRKQIVDLVRPNTSVIEFGCGNGDLLFKLSNTIRTGIGIDNSESLITYATDRIEKEDVKNLDFKNIDITTESIPTTKVDYSIASLLFHVLNLETATELLKRLISSSESTIICGFSEPENAKQSALLWFDQRFTRHFTNYKIYKKNGFTEGLLNSIENLKYTKIDTFDPVIKIYIVKKV